MIKTILFFVAVAFVSAALRNPSRDDCYIPKGENEKALCDWKYTTAHTSGKCAEWPSDLAGRRACGANNNLKNGYKYDIGAAQVSVRGLLYVCCRFPEHMRDCRANWGQCGTDCKKRFVAAQTAAGGGRQCSPLPGTTRNCSPGEGQCPQKTETCIAGGVEVVGENGAMKVRDLQVGDKVKGINEEGEAAACTVTGIRKYGDSREVVGGFTKGHLVVTKDGVSPAEDVSAVTSQGTSTDDVFDFFTDCPAVETVDETLFTPLSTVFCGQYSSGMTWAQYRMVWAFVANAIKLTGADTWLNFDNYRDSDECQTTGWQAALPQICHAVIHCGATIGEDELLAEMAVQNGHCDKMEEIIDEFIGCHMQGNAQARIIEENGSVGQVMVANYLDRLSRPASYDWMFYLTIALALTSFGLAVALCRRQKQKNQHLELLMEEEAE